MNWLALTVLGALLTWLGQTSGPTRRLWRLHPLLTELGDCDLCLGTWVCALLAYLLGCNVIAPVYVPVVSEIITGAAVSFALHLGRIGWKERFCAEVTYVVQQREEPGG